MKKKNQSYVGRYEDKTKHFVELWNGMDDAARAHFREGVMFSCLSYF